MTKSEINGVDERIQDVLKITNNYNYEDLVKAIFCINIDINNRSALSCQMVLNLSLVEYQKVGDQRINTYEEFEVFFDKIKSVLDITPFDDYIVEDFGEVKFRYENKYYKVIVGTGHNQVYGELFCLDTLARKKKKEKELREIFKYTSEIIEFFEKINLNDEKNGIRFQLPNKSLFEKTDIFFNTKLKDFNLHEIADIVEGENLPIEKIYFLKNSEDNVYPLWNTAILIDLFDKWYKDLNDEERAMIANETINKLISDLTILELDDEPNVFFPISLFEDGIPNLKTKYSFFIKCDKGAIIAINREQFTNYGELEKTLSSLKEMHLKSNLQLFELRKRRGKNEHLGITISKECPLRIIIYNNFVNVSEYHQLLVEEGNEYYECSTLDLIYMLLFMDSKEELFDYITESDEKGYSKLFAFGGDASRFLFWKESDHMLIKGALTYNVLNIDYTEDSGYVLDYFKNTLKEFPFECKDNFLFSNPFIWQVTNKTNGDILYVGKMNNNFGGNLLKLKNGLVVLLVHNLDFYNNYKDVQNSLEQVRLIDELNLRKIKRIQDILGESINLKDKLLEILFLPMNYGKRIGMIREQERKYVYSDLYEENNTLNIRYMVNYEEIQKDILQSQNRTIENQYIKELLKPLGKTYKKEYEEMCEKLDRENELKKEVDVFCIDIDYIYNKSFELYSVKDLDYLKIKKDIAKICLKSQIEPGEYYGKEANKVIRAMQEELISNFEKRISEFDRIDIHKRLLEICANTYNEVYVHRRRIDAFSNLDEKVLEEVQLKTINDRETGKHNLRVLLYFIETNLFLERDIERKITKEELNELLAFSNWLVVLNDNADICHFTEDESHINVNFDYVVDTLDENNEKITEEFIRRVYTNKDYSLKNDDEDKRYLKSVVDSFEKDTKIKLINLFDICNYFQIYSIESQYCTSLTANVYSHPENELILKIQKYIQEIRDEAINEVDIKNVLEFMTIIPSGLKTIENKTDYYLPIGERRKRNNRFDVKPLLFENAMVIFSPVVISNFQSIWKNGLLDNYLPYEVGLSNTYQSLAEWKKRYEKEMVFDIERILKKCGFAFVRPNVQLHKIDKTGQHPEELGDYDILAIDDIKLRILIIESKVLKKVGSFFEMFNQQRGFFKDHKEDEHFQRRIDYMRANYKKILKVFKFDSSNDYKVIPYMVTNKVMTSRYKEIEFPIISIGELENILNAKNE